MSIVQLTTTEARPGGKAPAFTRSGWHYTAEYFPAGQHTRGDYPGQLCDVYARHALAFALDIDGYKPGVAEAWRNSATGYYLSGIDPYITRGTGGSQRYLVAVTPEQAARWWPVAGRMPWGEIRSAGIGPSPGARHPSGDRYEAVPGPDAVRYPHGLILHTNVVHFDAGLRTALEADGARSVDDRGTVTGDADLPADDGRCSLAMAWLAGRDFTDATPRGTRANAAVCYLKAMDAAGHLVGGVIDEVIGRLPNTSDADFAGMWATAPVPAGVAELDWDCCGDTFWGFDRDEIEVRLRVQIIPRGAKRRVPGRRPRRTPGRRYS